MIPAALIAILAIGRLGAIHAVVFGGFAAASLAQRVDASRPVVIVTASCGIEGAKPPTPYRDFIQGAIEQSKHKPRRVLVWQRPQLTWDISEDRNERDWAKLVQVARQKGQKAECVAVKSNDPLYIIYTSGTSSLLLSSMRLTCKAPRACRKASYARQAAMPSTSA